MLISDDYAKEQQRLHESNPDYGVASETYAPMVSGIIKRMGVTQLLDYGAGKGRLMRALKVPHKLQVQCYDPGVPEWSAPPIPMQMCACIDVLEHIEPEYLDAVLDDLKRVTLGIGFFTVHCGPAKKVLSDGRNAHLIQQPAEWWLPKIMQRFDLHTFQAVEFEDRNSGFFVIVYARPEYVHHDLH